MSQHRIVITVGKGGNGNVVFLDLGADYIGVFIL